MQKVVLIGAVLGLSASVPIVFQASPDTFIDIVRPAPQSVAIDAMSLGDPKPAAGRSMRRVAVPADDSGHFRTALKINGRKVEGLIDTGATYVALNESTARKLGISITRVDFKHEVNTANGKTKAALVGLDTIEIGRIKVSGVDAVVLEDRALGDILVGMNLLKQLARFEVKGQVLVMEQ